MRANRTRKIIHMCDLQHACCFAREKDCADSWPTSIKVDKIEFCAEISIYSMFMCRDINIFDFAVIFKYYISLLLYSAVYNI